MNVRMWRELGKSGGSGPHVVRILRANGFGRTLQHVVRFVDTHEVVVDYLAAISAVSGNAEFVPYEPQRPIRHRAGERSVAGRGHHEIGIASGRAKCVSTLRSGWVPAN